MANSAQNTLGRMTQAQKLEPLRADPREIRFDQVRLLSRNVPVIIIANLLNSLLTVAFFGDVAPPWVLGVWLMLTVTLSAIGSSVWWARRDEAFWRDIDASVIRRITLCAGLGGGLWGLFALIVFPPNRFRTRCCWRWSWAARRRPLW